jgi:transcriptional regulator of acetoin/glycerol metabolism
VRRRVLKRRSRVVPMAEDNTRGFDLLAEACLAKGYTFHQAITIVRERMLQAALRQTDGNLLAASRLLKINRKTAFAVVSPKRKREA